VLYTITFKSGAQQEFDFDQQTLLHLIEGFDAVNRKGQDGILRYGDSALLLGTVAAFGPYISMRRKYQADEDKNS